MNFFKWSLVPTKQINKLSNIEDNFFRLYQNCRDRKATYECVRYLNSFVVVRVSELENTRIIIKEFPFNDDVEYAKLCADELVEHLNETI